MPEPKQREEFWFVEERHFDGTWKPALYSQPPNPKGPEGAKRKFRSDPKKIHPSHHMLSLTELVEAYSTKE